MISLVFRTAGLLLLLGSGGCTLISFSAISSIASLGNSSVSEGRDSYFFGKLKTAEMARFDLARSAVKAAAADLGLKARIPEKLTADRSEMGFVDDGGEQIGVRIDRRAGNLIRLRVDVGLFGSEVTDRLFLLRVRAHLPGAASQPDGVMPQRTQARAN